MALHGDKLGPAVLLGAELHLRELIGPHARGANVANLAGGHEVMQRAHGLGDGRVRVETVDPEKVDVGCAEALEGGVDTGDERGTG